MFLFIFSSLKESQEKIRELSELLQSEVSLIISAGLIACVGLIDFPMGGVGVDVLVQILCYTAPALG
jgi:hypothetical protein